MMLQEILQQAGAASSMEKVRVSAPGALNEASDYTNPSSFSRALRLTFGNFRAQLRQTFSNIAALLAAEGATWKDIVRTTCYLRDIDRDYGAFNEERTAFYAEEGLDPLPASTGIQAILCRPELLVEIEAIAVWVRP